MTDTNKKTLGLSSGTLGLSKSSTDKLSTAPSGHSKLSSSTTSSSHKGKVVVVTKNTRPGAGRLSAQQGNIASGGSGIYIPEKEKEKRLQLIKNAELGRKQDQERRLQNQIPGESADDSLNSNQLESSSDQNEHSTDSTNNLGNNDTVATQVDRIHIDDIMVPGRVKNLDSILRPVKTSGETQLATEKAKAFPSKQAHPSPDKAAHGKPKKQFGEEAAVHTPKKDADERKSNKKMSVTQVMMMNSDEAAPGRRRSLASIRRARDKIKRKLYGEQKPAEKIIREVNIPDVISVSELSNRMAEKSADVVKSLMKLGMLVTLNQIIDADTAELIVSEFGHKVKRVTDAELETSLLQKIEDIQEHLITRSPVVTIMGHVDHGKTSLLDALRDTDIAAGEAGGITQHIGAYQVKLKSGREITFLDTPGHEAFTAMRMRGAKVTDIVVLVVAADDGIMQQTIEAISHSKAANVPIIVAVNKIDKPDANPQRIKNELLQHGLVPDDMGGDVMIVEVSAKQKLNLEVLEETILIQADMLDLKANPNRSAEGAVIESKIEKGRGVVSTLLVQKGTLKVGDIVVAGATFGKIKALINDKGRTTDSATPSMPIEVLGLENAPVAGDEFSVVPNEKTARDLISLRVDREKQRKLVASKSVTLEQLFKKAQANGLKELAVIIKADVQGSIEAIAHSLQKLGTEEIAVRVLHSAVGGITESDISLASASRAIIIGFNVRASQQARELAKLHGIDIRYYSIIYNIIDDIKAAMSGMLSPVIKETIIGYVDIREVFDLTKFGKIAGCYVTEGVVRRGCNVRIIRDSVVVYDGKLKALRRFKDDVKEVTHGFECGISLENYEDMKIADKIEAYELTSHARTL